MSVVGTVRAACPACGRERDCTIVQSINARTEPRAKQQLLAGELDVLVCDCGARTQLVANLVFHDPDRDVTCQVVPGGERALLEAAARFTAAGITGTARLVPSLNALVEKIKISDADLEDWAIEMTKLLLLAATDPSDLDRVLLFERVDRDARIVHWIRFGDAGEPELVASSLDAYERLAAHTSSRPRSNEYQIDRAWAVAAIQTMISTAN